MQVLDAARQCRARLTRPRFSVADYLATLAHYGLIETAAFLEEDVEAL